jgi:phosphoadenosine phosphosulfate reductase
VRFDAHYNITTVDPPELIYFMREHYPLVEPDSSGITMWKLIEKNGLPTQRQRFCCRELKEHGGDGRICVTGVRKAESVKRSKRKPFEIIAQQRSDSMLFNDNSENRRLFETCTVKGERIVNPIIDWLEPDVWEYHSQKKLCHCCLYDQGQDRLGCIGCPMGNTKGMVEDFTRYPKFYNMYLHAAAKHLKYRESRGKRNTGYWETPESYMHWWIYRGHQKQCDGQIEIEEELKRAEK